MKACEVDGIKAFGQGRGALWLSLGQIAPLPLQCCRGPGPSGCRSLNLLQALSNYPVTSQKDRKLDLSPSLYLDSHPQLMLDIEFLNEKQDSTGEGTALWNTHVHARTHTHALV